VMLPPLLIDLILLMRSLSQYVKELFNCRLAIADLRLNVDVKIMNLKVLNHIIILKNYSI